MKASSVNSTTSSTFRNHRPVTQVNDSAYQPGEQYRHNHQQEHEEFEKELEISRESHEHEDTEKENSLTLEQLENETSVHIDKELDDKMKKIEVLNKKKKMLQKYKSSI